VALVTGSSSGLGAAIARRLHADGMAVVITSKTSVGAGEELAARLGGSYVQADVGDEADCRRLVETVLSRHGRLDVLVNNAGTTRFVPHADLAGASRDVWEDILRVNLLAPFALVTAAEAALRERSGAVVNISSIAGVRPVGSCIPYAVSKAALNHLTALLAKALGPAIRVNAVAPGLVATPWTTELGELHRQITSSAALGRAAVPEEIADVVAAVLRATYLTGQVVVVDGGASLVAWDTRG
jgi:NAD(P)-dependent dehydrogenase (short-subunit alcohol dehydrogenase family)